MPAEFTFVLPEPGHDLQASADIGDLIRVETPTGSWRATLTFGASSVRLAGPERTFTEPTAGYPVRHDVWVRSLSVPFTGTLQSAWLRNALQANRRQTPDVFAIAMQYLQEAPPLHDGGLQIAGPAAYGPVVNGARQERSDFNDYLGITWSYADGRIDQPEPEEFRSLDCSGYMRMVWGYRQSLAGLGRASIPLCYRPLEDQSALPRRAYQMHASAPGVMIIDATGQQITNFSDLLPGDLVFFDAATNDGTQIDHVGMYLGFDEGAHHRFISSRKTHNGPTLGDVAGPSILDGTGFYARSFRSARRL
jgi:cell wall-associated NlpC family hydrolase